MCVSFDLSVGLLIYVQQFHYFINKLSQKSLYNLMSRVLLFACPIKLNISTKNRVRKILPKKLYCEFVISSDLYNAIKKILDKI